MKIKIIKITRRKILALVLIVGILTAGILIRFVLERMNPVDNLPANAYSEPQSLQIMAGGSIVSQKQENLHFQAGGKLVYLPFKEGDQVSAGQVIASLDSSDVQKSVDVAEANYNSAKAALDLVIDNIHQYQYGNGGFANVGSANETQTQKTQRQQAEGAVNAAYDNLQKAQNQFQNTSLAAPFDGTLVSEDARDAGVNITPATSFVIADLSQLVFEAQVPDSNIGDISVGDGVRINLDSARDRQFIGTVSKIYPEKIKLSSGGEGYRVDIESDQIKSGANLGTGGSVLFEKRTVPGKFVPAWAVLGNQYVWVMDQNTPQLKKIEVGETFGDRTQILGGLSSQDKVILDPKIVIKKDYPII